MPFFLSDRVGRAVPHTYLFYLSFGVPKSAVAEPDRPFHNFSHKMKRLKSLFLFSSGIVRRKMG